MLATLAPSALLLGAGGGAPLVCGESLGSPLWGEDLLNSEFEQLPAPPVEVLVTGNKHVAPVMDVAPEGQRITSSVSTFRTEPAQRPAREENLVNAIKEVAHFFVREEAMIEVSNIKDADGSQFLS